MESRGKESSRARVNNCGSELECRSIRLPHTFSPSLRAVIGYFYRETDKLMHIAKSSLRRNSFFPLLRCSCRRLGTPQSLALAEAAIVAFMLAAAHPASAQTEMVLHSFAGKDGSLPAQRLTLDSAGNLYGSTAGNFPSIGSIFKLTPAGTLNVLYAFPDSQNRLFTTGKLILDSQGNLYGVDQTGGVSGNGSIFKLTASGVFKVLYSFTGNADGAFPNGVISDAQGNFYGTTNQGGAFGQGTVFKFTPGHSVKALYSFGGQEDGGEPFDNALYRDSHGNLFGTTMFDGGLISFGVVFKVTPAGVESVLHTFTGGSDGDIPKAV